jgi:hypothetical protein
MFPGNSGTCSITKWGACPAFFISKRGRKRGLIYKFMAVTLLDTARSFIHHSMYIIYYPIHPLPANKLILPWNLIPLPLSPLASLEDRPDHGKEGEAG